MKNYTEPLIPEATYHIYTRANGFEKLFKSPDNYAYFLWKYRFYIHPVADTYCFCLMPNHFHILVEIKNEKQLLKHYQKLYPKKNAFPGAEVFLSHQFSKLLNCYSKAFNKQQGRLGSLFMHRFKRKKIDDKNYLYHAIRYIHQNPVNSGFCEKPSEWPFSSYREFQSGIGNLVKKEKVISLFGDKKNFINFHKTSSMDNEWSPRF